METPFSIANDKPFCFLPDHGIAPWKETLHPLLPAMDEAEVTP